MKTRTSRSLQAYCAITLFAIKKYEPVTKITVIQKTPFARVYVWFLSLPLEPIVCNTCNFKSLNWEVIENKSPAIPTYISTVTRNIKPLSFSDAVKRLLSKLPSSNKPPAFIANADFVSVAAAERIFSFKASISFMERFSFQGMVKGMQLLGCSAILGETLRQITFYQTEVAA